MVGTTFLRVLLASSLFLATAATVHVANAQLMEPDGYGPIPTDPRTLCNGSNGTSGSIGCTGATNQGDFQEPSLLNNLDNMSLMGLFRYYEMDNLGNILVDYRNDAKTQPATFNPLCSIQGKMLMHGGGCFVDFGWYCADGTPNPVIHPLITAQQIYDYAKLASPPYPKTWQNTDGAFLPKTGYELDGALLSDIPNNADFQACSTKKIGFAVKGNSTVQCGTTAGCACAQNKYTEQNLNQINTASGQPYIDAVVYTSKKYPGRFYVAIEDLPTSATNFIAPYCHKNTGGTCDYWTADGDFNDFVYSVEGVVCSGGGQLCTVPGQQGICATGVTSCVDSGSTAQPACNAVFQPLPEKCNAIDDDCNGSIDDGDNLCPTGQICYQGNCVGPCSNSEFACKSGQACVGAGYCVNQACANVTCAADQKCVNQNGTGVCVGGCTGVNCGLGQQCVAGTCVDLCSVRTTPCPTNFVCQNGACVPDCNCLPCADGLACASNGQCLPSGCENSNCVAPQICIPGGNCVDPCATNTCAAPTKCSAFTVYDKSKDPNGDGSNQYACTNPDGTVVGAGGSGNVGGSGPCLGCSQAGSGTVGGNGAGPTSPASSTGSMGCGCRVAGDGGSRLGLAGILGLALLALRRQRRN